MKAPKWEIPARPPRRARPQGQGGPGRGFGQGGRQGGRRGGPGGFGQQRPPFDARRAFPEQAGVKEDFVPSELNQPGQQYPQVNSQG